MGTIVKDGDVLRVEAADVKHRLDSQREAKKYEGKDVKVMGTLDKTRNLGSGLF